MSLIDRLKYDLQNDDELVHREPKDNLTLGTQLIVNASQEAVFLKEGAVAGVFGPGTHTLSTANLPVLQSLVNLPFGGKTPFAAEVYFVNHRAKLDLPWGTETAIQLMDPAFGFPVPVRAHGQFGVSAGDASTLVTRLVGALTANAAAGDAFTTDSVRRYFRGIVVQRVSDRIARFVARERTPVLELSAHLSDLSDWLRAELSPEFASYGISLLSFSVMSISVPRDDPAVKRMYDVLAERAEFQLLGENYRVRRSFDVLEKAAENSGGVAGSMLAGGLGVGIGLGAGSSLGRSLAGEVRLGSTHCTNCNALLSDGANFCPTCGTKRA